MTNYSSSQLLTHWINLVKQRYLEVTYRKGKAVAAYLYLPRSTDAHSVRTEAGGPGLRVDYDATGSPIGVEITSPANVTLEQISTLLQHVGQTPLNAEEWTPLRAA